MEQKCEDNLCRKSEREREFSKKKIGQNGIVRENERSDTKG